MSIASTLVHIINVLYPASLVQNGGIYSLWQKREEESYRNFSQVVFSIGLAVIAVHFLSIDSALHLQPEWFWSFFRISCGTLCIACVAQTHESIYSKIRVKKFLPICTIFSINIFQMIGFVLEPRVPLMIGVVVPFLTVLCLRFSAISSIILLNSFLFTLLTIIKRYGLAGGQSYYDLVSAISLANLFTMILKANDFYRTKAFLEEHIAQRLKQQVIETQKDLTEQISKFVPQTLFKRITAFHTLQRTSFAYATQEILKPRKRHISCVWSDIRDFTKMSQVEGDFLRELAIPNIRHLTQIAVELNGVPRLIGDLIMSYFDDLNEITNIRIGLLCAAKFTVETQQHLLERQQLKRNAIVTCGPCVVGNIGSDDCREITALGSAVNLAQRIDELLSKASSIDGILRDDVVISSEVANTCLREWPDLPIRKLETVGKTLMIRNFESQELFCVNAESILLCFEKASLKWGEYNAA